MFLFAAIDTSAAARSRRFFSPTFHFFAFTTIDSPLFHMRKMLMMRECPPPQPHGSATA